MPCCSLGVFLKNKKFVFVLISLIHTFSRVPEIMPLYDILNEFQKGHSHMAVVVRRSNKVGEEPAFKSPGVGNLFPLMWQALHLC